MQSSVIQNNEIQYNVMQYNAMQYNAMQYLAIINQTGGLYGRILTEVVSTDRTRWGLYTRPKSRFSHTDRLSSVNKMFIIWRKQK